MAGRVETEIERREPGHALVELTAGEALPILLVDDRPENLHTLEAVLAPLGLPMQRATSGYEALRLLLEQDFALILLDVRMPGLDGLQTAELIKGRERSRFTPIVFLTAARDDLGDMIRGYGVGGVDYVLKPFDAELLRSKVAVFAELEQGRRALKRSEAFLRAAFEAAPIGKTVLDADRRILLANPAFGGLLEREPQELHGVEVTDLCHPDDRRTLSSALDHVSHDGQAHENGGDGSVDLRLHTPSGGERWVNAVASAIEPGELTDPVLLIQWVDITARRRAEEARGQLLLEHAARKHAEDVAERLSKLQQLADAAQSLSPRQLIPELAIRLAELFGAEAAELAVERPQDEPMVVQAGGGRVLTEPIDLSTDAWVEQELALDSVTLGHIRLAPPPGKTFGLNDLSLLRDAADRVVLAIRRAQLHEREHLIAVELQRGLVPKRLPQIGGVELSAHYQPAGGTVEVGGDWYDAFALPDGRIGIVLGDVAGKGIPAASTMGQLRSVTRALALSDEAARTPGEVLTQLNRYQLSYGENELFTLVYAIVDPRGRSVTWASAGHLPPLLRTAAGETEYLPRGDRLMGIDDLVYGDLQHRLGTGGMLVLYTDGLVERRGESLDAGLERLAAAVASGPSLPQALCEHVLDRLVASEQQLHDDVTAVIVRVV